MDETERIQKIRFNFLKLKEAHQWCQDHFPKEEEKDRNKLENDLDTLNILLGKVEEVYTDLESLGVEKTFSAAVFIFGPLFTKSLYEQFKKES